ncbi:MAG TPA: beta-galactosidase, partial [Gemmataceae bacterium]|nr:beta-galactosidase [Gemmataceae bacterium]
YDAAGWKEGPGGFGTRGTPGAVVRTEWNTADIWLRREFTLPGSGDLYLSLHHDEDAEVYLNGVLAAKVQGFVTGYEDVAINEAARKALKPGGKNVIAIHCHQTTGGQYIDAGLIELKERRP